MVLRNWFLQHQKLLLIVLVAGTLLFSGLGKAPIYILDEARNAQCAREMLQRNDVVVPIFNNELRVQKPPLHYYAMMAAYKIFGTNPFAARFFSACCGVVLMVALFNFLRKNANENIAFLATLILLCSTHFLFEFRLSVPDPYLILFFTITMLCMYQYFILGKVKFLYAASLALALAVLAKGPVAIGLAGLPIIVFAIMEKKLKMLFKPQLFWAILLFLIVATPWFVLVHKQTNGAFTKGFFLEQNLQRFSTKMEGHGGLFIIVPAMVFVGMLPFATFIFEALKKLKINFKNSLVKYCVLTIMWVLIVFSISSTKLPNYPMLCYPFLAIWLAIFINQFFQKSLFFKSYPLILLAGLNAILAAAVYVAFNKYEGLQAYKWWSILFLLLAIFCTLAINKNKQQYPKVAFKILITVYVVFNFIVLNFTYPYLYKNNPVTTALAIINNKKLYAFGQYNAAFNFATNTPILNIANADSLFLLWQKQPYALIVARENEIKVLEGKIPFTIIHKYRDLFETPTTLILAKKN